MELAYYFLFDNHFKLFFLGGFCRYELLFYPRYHLDQSSLLCKKSLLTKPIVIDVYQDYILVAYRPFDIHILHVKLSGELTPTSNPDLQVKMPSFCDLHTLAHNFKFISSCIFK